MPQFWVYIMSNLNRTVFYTGFTSDLGRRVMEHREGIYENAFTKRYNCYHLMWFEEYSSAKDALATERRIKRWLRPWKEELIFEMNPEMEDLAGDW